MAGATMAFVVDASVAIKFLVREHDTEQARQLIKSPEILIAPDWLLVEAANTFWKKVKRSELLAIHAERHMEDLPLFFGRLFSSAELATEALRLGLRMKHPVYDCVYLALALRENAKLVTADEEFHVRIGQCGMSEHSVLLSDFAACP
jgi:predicted nucleic acid-binding protein